MKQKLKAAGLLIVTAGVLSLGVVIPNNMWLAATTWCLAAAIVGRDVIQILK